MLQYEYHGAWVCYSLVLGLIKAFLFVWADQCTYCTVCTVDNQKLETRQCWAGIVKFPPTLVSADHNH